MRNRDRSSSAIFGHSPQGGLTKREYAAIAAMQGLLARKLEGFHVEFTAQSAVEVADALFDELDKGGDDA